jgi:3-methyl-2-oxobutanoate hydroxymethyltransferase
VLNDLLGLDSSFTPKFVKRFAELGHETTRAVARYVEEVKAQQFPADEHPFHSSAVRLVPVAEEPPEEMPGVMGAPV